MFVPEKDAMNIMKIIIEMEARKWKIIKIEKIKLKKYMWNDNKITKCHVTYIQHKFDTEQSNAAREKWSRKVIIANSKNKTNQNNNKTNKKTKKPEKY